MGKLGPLGPWHSALAGRGTVPWRAGTQGAVGRDAGRCGPAQGP